MKSISNTASVFSNNYFVSRQPVENWQINIPIYIMLNLAKHLENCGGKILLIKYLFFLTPFVILNLFKF